MYVMQVVHIRLTDKAQDTLSARAYQRTKDWLATWTPVANFKAVLADTSQAALTRCKQELSKKLFPSWLSHECKVTPDMFEFEVSSQKVEDNEFWMSLGCVWGHWHSIPAAVELDEVPA